MDWINKEILWMNVKIELNEYIIYKLNCIWKFNWMDMIKLNELNYWEKEQGINWNNIENIKIKINE